jgi:hypothetical protein
MASNVCAAFRGRTSSNPAIPKASANRASARRSAVVTRAGFLDFLTAPPKVAARGRANDLVDRLLELSDGTEGGIRASPATREAVGEVVDELEAFCPKAPLRSELIFGEWEVCITICSTSCICPNNLQYFIHLPQFISRL